MSRKQADGVEAMLHKADAALDEWFQQSRMTTQEATVAFARFLDRTKRQGAGALRHQVDGLQASLKKLSSGLEQIQREPKISAAKPRRRATTRPKTAAVRRPGKVTIARRPRKAA